MTLPTIADPVKIVLNLWTNLESKHYLRVSFESFTFPLFADFSSVKDDMVPSMMYGGAGARLVQGLCFDADCNPGNAFLEYMDTNFPDSGFAFMFCIQHFTLPDSHL